MTSTPGTERRGLRRPGWVSRPPAGPLPALCSVAPTGGSRGAGGAPLGRPLPRPAPPPRQPGCVWLPDPSDTISLVGGFSASPVRAPRCFRRSVGPSRRELCSVPWPQAAGPRSALCGWRGLPSTPRPRDPLGKVVSRPLSLQPCEPVAPCPRLCR